MLHGTQRAYLKERIKLIEQKWQAHVAKRRAMSPSPPSSTCTRVIAALNFSPRRKDKIMTAWPAAPEALQKTEAGVAGLPAEESLSETGAEHAVRGASEGCTK